MVAGVSEGGPRAGARGETARESASRPSRVSDVQRQARALGDPTRYAIFRAVAESRTPVRVAQLAESFGLNHNAVRQHLAKLCDAGLVDEEIGAERRPGRPPLQYRLVPQVAGAWGTAGPYEDLALMLLEVAGSGRSPDEVGRDIGRRVVEGLAPADDPLQHVEQEMSRRGFEPQVVQRGRRLDLVLGRCAFAKAAAADPLVCELHRGLAEGMLDGLEADLGVRRFVVAQPERGGCRIELAARPAAP